MPGQLTTVFFCAALTIASMTGCSFDVNETVDGLSQAVMSGNRMSGNRMSGNRMSGNRMSGNSLTASLADADSLHKTEEGRELLTYIVKCALPEGEELVVLDDDGETVLHSFPGLLGLAPEWMDGPLPKSGQRWITSCLMAHVNAFGVEVPISVRGPHASLTTTEVEDADFTVREGAFWGNIFEDVDGDGEADIQLYACRGTARSSSPYFAQRVCAQPSGNNDGLTKCGFIDMGRCRVRSHTRSTCRSGEASNGFTACRDANSVRYSEVITTYLAE